MRVDCIAKRDASNIAFNHLPEAVVGEKVAFHTNVLSFLWRTEPFTEWRIDHVHPSALFIARYITAMSEEVVNQSLICVNDLHHLYLKHRDVSGGKPSVSFDLTALSAVSYAVDQLRGLATGELTDYACVFPEPALSVA